MIEKEKMQKSFRIWKFLRVIFLRNIYAIALIGIATPHHHLLAQTTTENYAAISEDNLIKNDSKNQDASIYFQRGVDKYNQRDFPGALTNFTKAIELRQDFIEAYYNRGILRIELGNYQGGIADFSNVINLDPSRIEAYYNRGNISSIIGDYQAAIADFNKVIQLEPNLFYVYSNRGVARSSLGDEQGAIVSKHLDF